MVTAVAVLALAIGLVRVADADHRRVRAQTAADVAALAGASVAAAGWPLGANASSVRAAAAAAAAANNSPLVSFEMRSVGSDSVRLAATVAGFTIERSVVLLTQRALPLPQPARGATVASRPDSALVVHAGERCASGVEVDSLSNSARAGLARAEAELGRGVSLATASLDAACARTTRTDPRWSMALTGQEVELSEPVTPSVRAAFARGWCQTGRSRFATSDSPACDGTLERFRVITTEFVI